MGLDIHKNLYDTSQIVFDSLLNNNIGLIQEDFWLCFGLTLGCLEMCSHEISYLFFLKIYF